MDPIIFVVAFLALLIIIVLVKTAVVVPQQNAFVVERLGTYSGTLVSGFHVLTPFVDVIRYRHSLKEQTYDIPEQVCITRDNVQVGVNIFDANYTHRFGRERMRSPLRRRRRS